MIRQIVVVFASVMLVCPAVGFSQGQQALTPDLAADADAAYRSGDWAMASAAYATIVASDEANGRAWYRYAVAQRELGRNESALDALKEAEKAGIPQQYTRFELAKVHAGTGEDEAALQALRESVDAGFGNFQALETDTPFEALRQTGPFADILLAARRNAMPCEMQESFHAFDFWLGEWRVTDGQGNLAGTNSITSAEKGCFLLERWTGAGGSTGTSINFLDATTDKWVQQWLSADGTQIRIEGGIENGSMVLAGHIHYLSTGVHAPFRGTWTRLDDGRVRQFFEQYNEGDESWAPWFEGFYERIVEPADDTEAQGDAEPAAADEPASDP